MGADAGHLSFVKHDDLIGVTDGADTLCHDEDGSVLRLFLQRLAQRGVRLEVQGREAVIENVELRLLHQRPGDGQTLLLSAGEVGPALCHEGLKPPAAARG